MFACSHSGPAAAVGDLPELPPGGSEVSRLCRPTAAAGGVARALHPCLLALSDGAAACQRRGVRGGGAGAAHQRGGQVHLVGAAAQPRSEERRVGEEGRSRWSPDHYKKKKNTNV